MTDPDRDALPARIAHTVARALASGALAPIATRQTIVADAGVPFIVRQVDSLARKETERRRTSASAADPFLPPDPRLTVGAISDTHLAVLNKFNVLPCHLLLVTRRFAPQESLLDRADLDALRRALTSLDGLAFYNGGAAAGASQPHKHLQLVGLPLADAGPPIPLEPRLLGEDDAARAPLPFAHALARIDIGTADLHRVYRDLLERIGIRAVARDGLDCQSAPYNLLATRRWMLAVPRIAACVDGVSVNALAFAGSLFVKDATQLQAIRRRGPMDVLRAAAGAAQTR